jgi:broad specificity phosphatase PhoE
LSNLYEGDLNDITRLIMIRHGKTKANKEARISSLANIELNDEGREQVKKLSKRLKNMKIDVLYSSPLLRTRQTAEIIAHQTGLEIIEDADLREFDFGQISNKTIEEVKIDSPQIYDEIILWMNTKFGAGVKRPEIPCAEEISDFEERIDRFSQMILKKHPSQIVAAVMHMATIKGFMSVLFGPPIEQHLNFGPFNASISIIDFYKEMPILISFNDVCHIGTEYTFGRVNLL